MAGLRHHPAGGADDRLAGGRAHLPVAGRGQRRAEKHLPDPGRRRHQGPGPPGAAADRGGLPGPQGRLGVPHRRRVNIPTERVAAQFTRKQHWYSGKHKRHGAAVQTVAAPDGELLWVSGVLPGKTVDIRAARRFGIAEKVLAFLGLLADLGYVGLHPEVVTGYKRKRGEKSLSEARKAANRAQASLRCIGERANAQLRVLEGPHLRLSWPTMSAHRGCQGRPGPSVHDP
ncbi:MAG TPA: transposase family protein [Micromonosporaceae bacterium]|nr:transposase family protein [Micromonosporaceae bacterium]